MKIAIFHQFMDNIGGAELVVLALARGLDADVYTTSLDLDKIRAMGYEDVSPRITSVGTVPKMAPFRQQISMWKMRMIDANNLLQKKNAQARRDGKAVSDRDAAPYDFFIIGGDWAVGAAVKNKPNLWYIHSPLNELWHFRKWIRDELLTPIKRPAFDMFVWFNRWLTRRYSKHVDIWVTNSHNVQERTKRFYDHDSTIIHPPVITAKSESLPSLADDRAYWLSVNRLFKHKRVDIQMAAFAELAEEAKRQGRQPERLIVVGSYEKGAAQFEEYKSYIESIKPANVEIMHWVDDAELRGLYAQCKGFITTATDEDFGMTAVEGMASGKPVIASNEGGYKESVIDGRTGVLVDYMRETDESAIRENGKRLAAAIRKINADLASNPDMYKSASLARAAEFDVEIFIQKIKAAIQQKANKNVDAK